MDVLKADMITYIQEWNREKTNALNIVDTSVIVPITLQRLYPLKREFWENPSVHYDAFDRLKGFWNAVERPNFYQLLVTPLWVNKELFFHAAIPFYVSSTDRDIESFMLTSDYPVDERAKFAALYTLGIPLRFNWKTGDVTKTTFKLKEPISH